MKLVFLALLLFSGFGAFAQFPLYYVYQIKGDAYILVGEQRKIIKIVPKMYIYKDNIVNISGFNTELKLMGYDKKLLTADTPCRVKAADLSKLFQPRKMPVSVKFLELVWEDIFQPHPQIINDNNENMTASWGGAERGADGCNFGLYPLSGQMLYKDTISFKWNSSAGANAYILAIYDARDQIIFQKWIPDTVSVIRNLDWKKMSADTDFYWTVKPEKSACPLAASTEFFLLTPQNYHKKLQQLRESVPKENDPIIYNLKISDILVRYGFLDEGYLFYKNSGFK